MTSSLCDKIGADPRALMEFERIRFELVWRHFEFHARQRTTMFHFFVILSPFLFGGCFVLFKERALVGSIPAIGAALAGSLLAIFFFLLDQRNKQLYRVSKNALGLMETQFLFGRFRALETENGYYPGVISTESRSYGDNNLLKHSLLMGGVYWLSAAMFLVLAMYFSAVRQGCITFLLPAN
ncbi:hypothetical protein [Tardiphaga robiniae]|uniref:Uncharacterized protein n=1 Tax=Tardiphaga robiniae TaxID=943830 RepID=A0A163Z6V1_9BRAD|nr:hypothetical protein [Tardiphaga robiniae]KZD22977.1 hypothetical protein A4A58_06110 [Tardiphaga robiniae]